MCAHEFTEPRSVVSRIEGLLTWLGGGHWRELGERHERSTHAVAGAVVVFGAALAWLVASLAVSESARWPMLAIVAAHLCLRSAGRRGDPRHRQRPPPGLARHRGTRGRRGRGRRCRRRARRARHVFRLDRPSSRRTGPAQRRLGAGRRAGVGVPPTDHETRALRSTTPSNRPASTRTKPWSSRAANTTPRRPARRPGSPAFPVPDPKHERQTSFSPTRSMSWTMRLAARDRQAPELDARIAREERALTDGAPTAWSRTPVGAWARAGSP